MWSFLGSETLAAAIINDDVPIKVIGANFQSNLFCILYLEDDPIPEPDALKGKTIGVQVPNEQIWQAVPAQERPRGGQRPRPGQQDRRRLRSPRRSTNGECDGFFSFITNEPNILRTQGLEVGR